MPYLKGNIAKLFLFDTWAASVGGQSLKEYTKAKHGWTDQQFSEYHRIYMETMASHSLQTALDQLNPPEYQGMEVS